MSEAAESLLAAVPALRDRASYSVPQPKTGAQRLLRLDANEGMRVSSGVAFDDAERVRRYPSAARFEARLAEELGVVPEQVLVTAGADEALDRVCRAWLNESRSILLPVPGFEMLTRYAELARAKIDTYDWFDAAFPAHEVLERAGDAAVVAVVTPNNPTGLAIDEQAFRALCEGTRGRILLVDLAYVEFADFDPTPVALEYEHAIVVRSLSKSWGIAGLRVGYACASPSAIAILRAAGSPYSVSAPSLAIAESLLGEGARLERERFAGDVRARRARIAAILGERGVRCWPSQANFVLCELPGRVQAIYDGLVQRGVAVRRFPGRPFVGDCLRITCGADEGEQALLERALTESLEAAGEER